MKPLTAKERRHRGIGWRAAVLRQRARISQAEAATRAGITLNTWCNMESGRPCQDKTLFAAAKAFGCDNLWLFFGARSFEERCEQIDRESQS